MAIILGIDPGSRTTGYGVIRADNSRYDYIASGCIRLGQKSLDHKLKTIYDSLSELIQRYLPEESAIEQVFLHENPGTALKLGQARGAAITALAVHELSVSEYSARQIKKAVVGYGAADKAQVQQMVQTLLKLSAKPQEDAADGLAIALCHAYTCVGMDQLRGIDRKMRYGRVR